MAIEYHTLKKRDHANNSNVLDYHSTTDYHSSIEDILRKQKEGNLSYFARLLEFLKFPDERVS